jgi:hypothetical protein
MPTVFDDRSSDASRSERAEHALRVLRLRIERHADQEVRLGRLYEGWQNGWSAQCDRMQGLMSRLETHLTTWLRHTEPTPVFSVVSAHDGE